MGFMDAFAGIFGGNKAPDFGRIDPNNVEHYWEVDGDVDEAERAENKGEGGALARALGKWGLRDMSHWESVKSALYARHQHNPDLAPSATRVSMRRQMAAAGPALAAHPLAPIAGISLNDIARAQVIRERNPGMPEPALMQALARHAIDVQSFAAGHQGWMERMDPAKNPAYAAMIRVQLDAILASARANM